MAYYVNINRQFGSLGRPIAKALAEDLGIEYYDRDIIEQTAKKMGIPLKEASDVEETWASPWERMAHPLGGGNAQVQDKLFAVEQAVILKMAAEGSAIFVGRCADFILRDRKCLNVFIYAPKEKRYLNCVNSLGMDPAEARKMMEQVDKARNLYWQRYAHHLPSDTESNQLMIDSSLFGVKGTAKLLADIVREYFVD